MSLLKYCLVLLGLLVWLALVAKARHQIAAPLCQARQPAVTQAAVRDYG